MRSQYSYIHIHSAVTDDDRSLTVERRISFGKCEVSFDVRYKVKRYLVLTRDYVSLLRQYSYVLNILNLSGITTRRPYSDIHIHSTATDDDRNLTVEIRI